LQHLSESAGYFVSPSVDVFGLFNQDTAPLDDGLQLRERLTHFLWGDGTVCH
jgi:hypothetical protein